MIIVPSDIEISPEDARIAAEIAQREKIKRICRSIKQQSSYLNDQHMTAFLNVANSSGLCVQPMAETLFAENIDQYEYYSTINTDGVQIIYQGNIGINSIGHFICIHYNLSLQTVFIYDPLYTGHGYVDNPRILNRRINAKTREIIRKLYPHHIRRVVSRPNTTQLDLKSCGVFAIAYATTILLGYDPTTYPLKLGTSQEPQNSDQSTDLRYHLANIIQNNQLQLFPSM